MFVAYCSSASQYAQPERVVRHLCAYSDRCAYGVRLEYVYTARCSVRESVERHNET